MSTSSCNSSSRVCRVTSAPSFRLYGSSCLEMSPAVSSSVKAVLDLTSKRLSPAIQRSSPLFFLQPHLYSSYCSRSFSHSIRRSATPLPTGAAAGPPPSAPTPAASHYGDRIGRRRKQAELLQRAKEARASQTSREGSSTQKKAIPLKRRFWDRVYVKSIKGTIHQLCAGDHELE